jgi:Flp pilus assembly protein TadD
MLTRLPMSPAVLIAGCSRPRYEASRALASLLSVLLLCVSAASGLQAQAAPPASPPALQTSGRVAAGNPAWKCQIDPALATSYGAASRACDAQFRAASVRAALVDGQSLGASHECVMRVADQVERATAAWAAADTAAATRTERVECEGRVLTTDSLSLDASAVLRVCPGKVWSWVNRGDAGQSCSRLRELVASSRAKVVGSVPPASGKDARRSADLTRDARDWYGRSEFSRARDLARRAVALDATNGLAHALLGASFSMLGEHAEAERALRSALAVDPNNSWAWGMLAQTLYFAQRDSVLLSTAHDALAVDGSNAEVLGFLGMSELRLTRTRDATATLTRATSLAPRDARFRASLARALRLTGRAQDAEAAAREAIRLQPDYYAGHAELGQVLELSGKTAEALAEYRIAHKLAEWDSETAQALERLGRK